MAAITPVYKISCIACNTSLCGPVISLYPCHHYLHRKCFDEIIRDNSDICPRCDSTFTRGIDNPTLEQIICKVQTITKFLRGAHAAHALSEVFHEAIEENEIALVDMFITQGISIEILNAPNSKGHTPLYVAMKYGYETLTLLLIRGGANIDIKTHEGSLLFCAVQYRLIKVVRELRKIGVDLCERDEEGKTVLHLAATQENSLLLRFLLQNGAITVIDALWSNKWTALEVASEAGHAENIRLLIEAGANQGSLTSK